MPSWTLAAFAASCLGFGGAVFTLSRRLRAARRALIAEADARARTECALSEREDRLQTIFESQPECVKVHGADGTVLAMNRAGLGMLGATHADEVIGSSVYRFIAPEHRERYRAVSASVFEGRAETMEFRLIGVGGRPRQIETRVVPLRDAVGGVVAALALTRDVTDRQEAEERARRHLSELARVARISSMGEMASGIAHELNQPLTAIVSHAGACLRRLKARPDRLDDVLESLNEISLQGQRAGEIIRHVRALVRRGETQRGLVDANEVVRTMVALAEPEARRHRVVLQTVLDAALPPLHASRVEIEQVVFNLLRNAIDAVVGSATSPREVTVITRVAAGTRVQLEIRDSGPGIVEADLERVFAPFYTTKAEGMGMGLSISRSIIEAHKGQLGVRCNDDAGATFVVTLPAMSQPVAA